VPVCNACGLRQAKSVRFGKPESNGAKGALKQKAGKVIKTTKTVKGVKVVESKKDITVNKGVSSLASLPSPLIGQSMTFRPDQNRRLMPIPVSLPLSQGVSMPVQVQSMGIVPQPGLNSLSNHNY